MFVGSAFQFVFSSSNSLFSLESVTLNSCYNTAHPRWIGSLPPIDVTDGSKTVFCQLPTSIGPWKPRKWNACEIALKCVNKLILFTGMFEFCRSNCFKERSQWRLESQRSPFFFSFLSVLFVVVVVFLLIIIILPWLVSLYSHCWPFTPCEIFIYIDYLEIPSWNFGFLIAPRNVSLVGLFLFPLSVLSGFIWERGNKAESIRTKAAPRRHKSITPLRLPTWPIYFIGTFFYYLRNVLSFAKSV